MEKCCHFNLLSVCKKIIQKLQNTFTECFLVILLALLTDISFKMALIVVQWKRECERKKGWKGLTSLPLSYKGVVADYSLML